MYCNLVKNDYQHASKVLFSFVPNKQFGQLLNISPHVFTMINTVNASTIDLFIIQIVCTIDLFIIKIIRVLVLFF